MTSAWFMAILFGGKGRECNQRLYPLQYATEFQWPERTMPELRQEAPALDIGPVDQLS
ncbi:hypothetical protein GCM10007071_11330 [Marinobacter zhanjiangensis]|uniref:Uncharacterized protein n=1 Tax=Marinobacter zhanjiangensis TaxID=578215 RepID=A0ABQ3AWQ2_9GAMM|nr:hypothetical protein GCM10007071_11330 [Marinobacter zhanjiangensis]